MVIRVRLSLPLAIHFCMDSQSYSEKDPQNATNLEFSLTWVFHRKAMDCMYALETTAGTVLWRSSTMPFIIPMPSSDSR